MFVLNNGDGTATESPSIKRVSEQIIDYWIGRARIAKHPVLCNRYADLAWDFSKSVTGKPAPYIMAQIVVDSTVAIAKGNYHIHKSNVIKKLERALTLAISLNDNERINKLPDIIMAYEDSIAEDSKLGLWGFSYDLLFDKEKVNLTAKQSQKLIDDLEAHLSRATQDGNVDNLDQWAAEAAATRLAKRNSWV